MSSKTSNTSLRPTVVVASSSTSKESSPTSHEKFSKKSKSSSKNHDGSKSRKRRKKGHKSKKSDNLPPPLPPSDEKVPAPPPPPPPPPPPLPLSNLYDDLDEKITTSDSVVKTNLPLSHSPPPVMPNILRQGSRPTTKEQLVPSSVLRSAKSSNANHSPTSTTNSHHPDDLATKRFEEQLALLDTNSSKLTMNNWDQSSGGSEEDEQIERICRMNNTGSISGPIQFKFNRTQNIPLKTPPALNDIGMNEDETVPLMNSTKKKRLHKPNDPSNSSHSSLSADENETKSGRKKIKKSETETTKANTTTEPLTTSTENEETIKTETLKIEEPVASTTTNEKKSTNDDAGHGNDRHSRSSSRSSSGRRKRSGRRKHRRRRRRHSSSSSSSSDSSTSSDSSRSSSSRSHRRHRRRRSNSSRSSSRSSSSSNDDRRRRSSRSSSRSYSRRRSSSSRSSGSSSSSRSSRSRSRSRSRHRRRSGHNHQAQLNNNGKGRGGNAARRGRGARNNQRGRRAQSNEMSRRSTPPNRNGIKYTPMVRKLPNNKQPRVLIAATPKPVTNEDNPEVTTATSTTMMSNEEIKTEPIILTTNPNQQRPMGAKKNGKGKNKQQTPAYSLKKEDHDETVDGDGEPLIGPKLPPEYEKKINKEHSFTPPDMNDPENMEMLNELKYRAEIHAAKNHGLISEIQAQQLIEERETQKQLAELPLIQMPIMQSPSISSLGQFIVATPNPAITAYQIQMPTASAPQIPTTPDPSPMTIEQQQQQQQQHQLQHQQSMSPNSAASSGGESCSTPGHTTPSGTATTVLTQDGQQMMIQTAANVNHQLVQIAQPAQQMYMPMQTTLQQPRVVAIRTPQGGIQHFIEYPTAQLLQAQQQQQQQPQFIQHNGQLVQVLRQPVGYSSAALMQQVQLQQQQQALAAQLQAQQLAAIQQSGGTFLMQNSAGQLVFAQQNPQAMRVVQLPYVPK